jgi:hypothetical protein
LSEEKSLTTETQRQRERREEEKPLRKPGNQESRRGDLFFFLVSWVP